MKVTFLAAISAFLILTLTGCGGDNNNSPPLFVTEILSESTIDGDIELDSFTDVLFIDQGNTQRVRAGVDPVSGNEYRAFLHFSLVSVPLNAIIESAFLEIFINNVDIEFPNDTIPVRIDLVSFQPPVLIESDFDFLSRLDVPPVTFPMFLADSGDYVTIDVTPLMIAAQNLKLSDFQVRIMEDFGDVPLGLIELNDTTGVNRSILAPLLTVNYF
ncbi:MAG: hypothetical protein CVU69_12125 [Deltaproteobacteria bacterium HGW-Deltaproteobacteria-4]|nr:MAG: hypothetical protein CVU69_12125 [Deltaproteobacteria bacterium HGW-Deltaproteobacteria-4]